MACGRGPSSDLPGLTVVLPGRVKVAVARDPEALQPASDGADPVVVASAGELEGDPPGSLSAIASPDVDELEDLGR